MEKKSSSKYRSKKYLLIYFGILVIFAAAYLVWQNYKYEIVGDKIQSSVASKTDSLYSITYDSIYFDEALGNAYIQKIHVAPDTGKIKKLSGDKLPYAILDIKINSIRITGVQTTQAIGGRSIIGDSLVIDQPEIAMYNLQSLSRQTKIENEAKSLYEDILGKLNIIKVNYVFINQVNVSSQDFYTQKKNFDLYNAKIQIEQILIDSAHNDDPNRVLFSKQAAFIADSFITYNNNRKEFYVNDINFSGKHQALLFKEILLNRFDNDSSRAYKLLEARDLKISGVNSDAAVKRKNLIIDTITCQEISFYQPPKIELKGKKAPGNTADTTGFAHVYSIDLRHVGFPNVNFISAEKSQYSLGNIAIKINNVEADEVEKVLKHPFDNSKEVEVSLESLAMKSADNKYDFHLRNIVINTLQKQLRISSFTIDPYTSELKFAANEKFQRDRYDLKIRNLVFSGIVMNDILNNKIIADQLVTSQFTGKIYRDLTKPLEKKSKVGNYPSQLLQSLELPVYLKKAVFNNAYVEYKERQETTDSTGIIVFSDATLTISNITNIDSVIRKNRELDIAFKAKALRQIPLAGNFIFDLSATNGKFRVNGKAEGFDALILNKVSIPMAMIRVKEGEINSLNFNFTGDDHAANGSVVLQYNDLKVDVLKRDKETNDIKKRGLLSLFANVIVRNSNPMNGNLRKEQASFDRNEYKSFFNLVWKTLFTGMKKSVGLP